jgi:hypothetical protein
MCPMDGHGRVLGKLGEFSQTFLQSCLFVNDRPTRRAVPHSRRGLRRRLQGQQEGHWRLKCVPLPDRIAPWDDFFGSLHHSFLDGS